MQVFVLLVNANTDNEGIHSINIGNRDIILMFEQEDDAARYVMLLEAQDFPARLTVECLNREEIEQFCDSAGYGCYWIPRDFRPSNDFERMLLVPPERNLEVADWLAGSSSTSSASSGSTPSDHDAPSEMSDDELEQIRRRLEGLL